jgi:diguanylate cyclase (GGDEF)-like protein
MAEQAAFFPRSDSEDLPVAVIFLDRDLRSLHPNQAWRDLAEDDPGESAWVTVCDRRDRSRVLDVVRGVVTSGREATLEVRGRTTDQWIELRVSAVDSDGEEGAVIVGLDITAHKQREAMLTFDALRDPLTGLHNRAALGQHLQSALDRLRRRPAIIAVNFIDLDGFGQVNEEHGHRAGDRALVVAAQQLRLAVRPADLVARVGGDEFVAVCEALSSAEEALGVARRLAESLNEPIDVSPTARHQLSATIGVAFAAGPHDRVETLMARADMAMYAAKQQGTGQIQLHTQTPARLEEPPPPALENQKLDGIVERLAVVEGDLAGGWAESLLEADERVTHRWRSACHYTDRAIAALRGTDQAGEGPRTDAKGR